MMRGLGHEICEYGPGIDPPLDFDPVQWYGYNAEIAAEIAERKRPDDFLCVIAGRCQQALAVAHPDLICVEYGVGYGGVFADFKVFESYAWMHTVYGAQAGDPHAADGNFYDCVIPNYFEVEDFPASDGGEYLLYVGRLIERKGMAVLAELAKHGHRVIAAGDGPEAPEGVELVGSVGPEQRAELMGGARALVCPTIYVEPFGGVAAEAQLCGTPVIATDWGAFSETVEQDLTGYRCRRLGEFLWAADHTEGLDRWDIRRRAIERWSLEAVAPQYERYFDHLAGLRSEGWYDATPSRPDWSLA